MSQYYFAQKWDFKEKSYFIQNRITIGTFWFFYFFIFQSGATSLIYLR